MAEATRTETFDVSIDKFFEAVTDYEFYPEIVPMMEGIEILQDNGDTKRIKYNLNLIKRFSYTLDLVEQAPTKLTWKLVESSIFKQMSGFWEFEDEGGKTKATYHTELQLPRLTPKSMVDKMVGSTLPGMMKSFAEHAKTK